MRSRQAEHLFHLNHYSSSLQVIQTTWQISENK